MSHNQGNTRDPVIDRVNDSDENEDEVPSAPGQEHIDLATPQDNASLLGSFNGEALGGDGSLHFKKGYNGNPLEVPVTPSLEDVPLPLEPVALNPFAIDIEPMHHHNSPLPSRSSEPHSFNVSVSDSLPPLVMELDSPEHSFVDHDIDENKGCGDIGMFKEAPDSSSIGGFAMSEKIFESEEKTLGKLIPSEKKQAERPSEKDFVGNGSAIPFSQQDTLPVDVLDTIKDILCSQSHSHGHGILASQGDLFSSQQTEEKAQTDPAGASKGSTALKDDREVSEMLHQPESDEPSQFPPTLSQRSGLDPFHSLHSTSPKRKRDNNLQENSGSKAAKLETDIRDLTNSDSTRLSSSKSSASLETSDNEIEIIDDLSQRDQSIEVLYDRKESEHEETQQGSQDIHLILTGASQSQSESFSSFIKSPGEMESSCEKKFGSFIQEEEREGSHSQSLLSMPSSDNLLCQDSLSSSPTETPAIEGTIRASQIESICQPTTHPSQPDIEPLLKCPILDKPPLSSNTSTSNPSTKFPHQQSLRESHSATSQSTQVTTSPQIDESSQKHQSPDPDDASSICMPHFETPLEDTAAEEQSESVFTKATEAAKRKLQQERSNMKDKPPDSTRKVSEEKDSFENASHNSDSNPVEERDPNSSSTPLTSLSLKVSAKQSTPVSSHVPESALLFASRKKSSAADGDALQNSNTLAADSDEEPESKKPLKPHSYPLSEKLKREVKKTSTPNQETILSPNISEGGESYIEKDDSVGSKLSEHSHSSPRGTGNSDTQEIKNSPIKTVSDLISSGGYFHQKIQINKWRGVDGTFYFSLPSDDKIYHSISEIDLNNPAIDAFSSSSSSSRGRISDVSTISRITTSSVYFGDKSGSSDANSTEMSSFFRPDVNNRLESTRHSIGSVTVMSPPRQPPTSVTSTSTTTTTASSSDSCDPEDIQFLAPKSVPKSKPQDESPGEVKEVEISTEDPEVLECDKKFASIAIQTDNDKSTATALSAQSRRGRGRGRPRGRSRGLLRATALKTILIEEEPENEKLPTPVQVPDNSKIQQDKAAVSSPKDNPAPKPSTGQVDGPLSAVPTQQDKTDDYLSKLPEGMVERLKACHIPMSEDDEELFALQSQKPSSLDDEKHKALILKKIREVDLKPDLLVFARYFDNNFYSAVIISEAKTRDRWDVEYNIDHRPHTVLEVNILPTYILPRGCFCYVRHHTGDFCDPGTVRGHILEGSILLHLIETHRGTIVKVPHSHLQLKASVAEEMLHSRRSFKFLASPGRDISLDNVIPMGRRKAALSSYTKGQTSKATSDNPASPKSSALPKSLKADPNFDTSGDEIRKSKKNSKSSQKRKVKAIVTVPGSSDTETDAQTSPKSTKRKVPSTPKTPKPPVADIPETIPTTSKSKAPSAKVRTPKKTMGSVSKSPNKVPSQEALHPNDNLLKNPVVQLIQLEEVAASPKSSPKKRGRKPNSSGKTPRKQLKLLAETDEESSLSESELGPLPPEGSNIFEGFYIMITSLASVKQVSQEGSPIPPLNKDHLTEQITRGGATVLGSFDGAMDILMEESNSRRANSSSSVSHKEIEKREKKLRSATAMPVSASPTRLLCISNTYCRTEKFIRCLTVGIPIVSPAWVIDSCQRNYCCNWTNYLLPAGMSLLTGNLMEQCFSDKYKDITSNVGQVVEVLKGEKVFLASSRNPKFAELWLTLLTAAQAQVFTMSVKSSLARLIDRRTSVVVADSTIPDKELNRARSVGVPVVSTEWFIQSLIARCKLQYDAHLEFQHDFRKVELPNER